jgi:predicted transposase YbfD/YdcC
MDQELSPRIVDHFIDILTITICAVVCNADTWEDIKEFGKAREGGFRKYLQLANGIPSHDTIRRVLIRVKPEQLQSSFLSWVRALRHTEGGAELIGIDGKTARRSFDSSKGKPAIHMVSAWANKNRLVLAQAKVEDKSNEIEAILQLLDLMEIQGCIVTIDAMGTQKKIAQRIREDKAEYVLALKGNQGTLLENVKLYLDDALARNFRDVPYDSHTTVEKDHGRFEKREYWVSSELSWLPEAKAWKDMQSIGMVRATRQIKGESRTETRYYISSLPADAKGFAERVLFGAE